MAADWMRVLAVASERDAAGSLRDGLEAQGLRAYGAVGLDAARAAVRAHGPDAVVIMGAMDDVASWIEILQREAAPRLAPVLVVTPPGDTAPPRDLFAAAVLRGRAHASQIAGRLRALLRETVMEDEIALRLATLKALGRDADGAEPEADAGAPQILFCGDPTPRYLGFERAVRAAGGSVTAAFTSFTAFDFLHEREFDAVVVSALEGCEPAFTVCAAMRRNSRLYHMPALLLVEAERFEAWDAAFERGADDVLDAAEPAQELARRVLAFAADRRRRDGVRRALARAAAPGVLETRTGLVEPSFFLAHLAAMAHRASEVRRPLSVMILRAETPPDAPRETRQRALRQAGAMVRQLVRAEDVATRIEPSVFAVAMPGAGEAAAITAARRLESVADCTAFEPAGRPGGFRLRFSSATAQHRAGETGSDLITRAAGAFRDRAWAI